MSTFYVIALDSENRTGDEVLKGREERDTLADAKKISQLSPGSPRGYVKSDFQIIREKESGKTYNFTNMPDVDFTGSIYELVE